MKYSSRKKAFTLVELLVSMSIVAIMASISISAYPSFSEQISVSAETYKMLAFFKETQSYGVASLSLPGVKVVYGYTVEKGASDIKRFEIPNPASASSSYYISQFSSLSPSATSTLKDRFNIVKIEGIKSKATTTLDKFYAFYKRPNPESRLVGTNVANSSLIYPIATVAKLKDLDSFDKVEITIESKKNPKFFKKVVILRTGQMYVADW